MQLPFKAPFLQNKSINNSMNKSSLPIISDIKYENFLGSDKRKLIENFVSSNEVMELIKKNLNGNFIENNKPHPFFQKVNLGETLQSKHSKSRSVKINSDMRYLNDLARNSSNSKFINFSMTIKKNQ